MSLGSSSARARSTRGQTSGRQDLWWVLGLRRRAGKTKLAPHRNIWECCPALARDEELERGRRDPPEDISRPRSSSLPPAIIDSVLRNKIRRPGIEPGTI
jgi:hypothetical protein